MDLKKFNKIRKGDKEFDYQKWALDFFDNPKNKDIGINIKDLSLTMKDFDNEDVKFDIDENDLKIGDNLHKFNTGNIVPIYRYETTRAGHKAERPFCQRLMAQTEAGKVFQIQDITRLNNAPGKADRSGGGGYSVFKFRGGNNCLHKWVKYNYDMENKKLLTKTFIQPAQPPLR